ncbi:hypothetical protein K440DRAFT_636461 [Wilcoxina mikolae CBS 423.85]|nr:hypothetical protein K440DRAFT_636461 [Wilcoxina mikolae CBS 423.85]
MFSYLIPTDEISRDLVDLVDKVPDMSRSDYCRLDILRTLQLRQGRSTDMGQDWLEEPVSGDSGMSYGGSDEAVDVAAAGDNGEKSKDKRKRDDRKNSRGGGHCRSNSVPVVNPPSPLAFGLHETSINIAMNFRQKNGNNKKRYINQYISRSASTGVESAEIAAERLEKKQKALKDAKKDAKINKDETATNHIIHTFLGTIAISNWNGLGSLVQNPSATSTLRIGLNSENDETRVAINCTSNGAWEHKGPHDCRYNSFDT